MADRGVTVEVSTRTHKKYAAVLPNGTKVHFGDSRFEQWKDSTPLKAYSSKDHGDPKRRDNYFARHGKEAAQHSAKYFAHKFLWGGS